MRGRRESVWLVVVSILIGFGIGFGQKMVLAAQEPCHFERRTTVSGNVYEEPSADAAVETRLEAGTKLTLVRGSFGWYIAILPDSRLGWVYKDLFLSRAAEEAESPVSGRAAPQSEDFEPPGKEPESQPASEPESPQESLAQMAQKNPEMVILKVDSGRVRESPSLNAPVEFGLIRGERVAVMDIRGEWYHIKKDDGRIGWSHRSLFTQGQPPSRDGRPNAVTAGPSDAQADAQAREEEPAPSAPPGSEGKQVESVRVDVSGRGEEKLIIKLNGFYPPETYVLEEGIPKVVCDFTNVTLARGVEPQIEVNGTFIRQVRTERLNNDGALRVIVELVPEKDYEVEQIFFKGENLYVLTFMSA